MAGPIYFLGLTTNGNHITTMGLGVSSVEEKNSENFTPDIAFKFVYNNLIKKPLYQILEILYMADPEVWGYSTMIISKHIEGFGNSEIQKCMRILRYADAVIGIEVEGRVYYKLTTLGKRAFEVLKEFTEWANEISAGLTGEREI